MPTIPAGGSRTATSGLPDGAHLHVDENGNDAFWGPMPQCHPGDNEVNAPGGKRQLLHVLGATLPRVSARVSSAHLPGPINTQIAGSSLLMENRTQGGVLTTEVEDV